MARSRESGKSRISHGLLDEVMLVQMQLCAGDGEAVDDDYDELGGKMKNWPLSPMSPTNRKSQKD